MCLMMVMAVRSLVVACICVIVIHGIHTSNTINSFYSQTTSTFSRRISCKCSCCPRNQTQVYKKDDQQINVTSALTIATNTLSANTRKYISIPDYRSSSTFLGTAAILFITLVCAFVSLPDIFKAAHKLNRKYHLVDRVWLLRRCRDGWIWISERWRRWDGRRFRQKVVGVVLKFDRCGLSDKVEKMWKRVALSEKLSQLWTNVNQFRTSCRERVVKNVCERGGQ